MPRRKSLSRVAWKSLTDNQKSNRILALEVLRAVRKGNSLTFASKDVGLSTFLSLKNLGRALFKKSGRWRATKTDSIQRAMQIYERGRVKTIVFRNSKDASLIGEYFSEVRNFLVRGDTRGLRRFKGKVIIDAEGKEHTLETRPQKILDIEDAKEDSEFFEIYEDE